jgi:hypothetical protein
MIPQDEHDIERGPHRINYEKIMSRKWSQKGVANQSAQDEQG